MNAYVPAIPISGHSAPLVEIAGTRPAMTKLGEMFRHIVMVV